MTTIKINLLSRFRVVLLLLSLIIICIVPVCNPTLVALVRFIDDATGKHMVAIVADRMVTFRGHENFHDEWVKQAIKGQIDMVELGDRVHFLTDEHKLTSRPGEDAGDSTPPKILLAGKDGNKIAVSFTGAADVHGEFAEKLGRRRTNWLGRPKHYNSLESVAKRLERFKQKTGQTGKQTLFAANGGDIYALELGRTKTNSRGEQRRAKPKVHRMEGNLYTSGYDGAASEHLEAIYGAPNVGQQFLNGPVLPRGERPFGPQNLPPRRSQEQVLADLRSAFHWNEISQLDGQLGVTENFEGFITGPQGTAQYVEHNPMLSKRIADVVNSGEVSEKDMLKRIMHHGAMPELEGASSEFELTPEQAEVYAQAKHEHEAEHDKYWSNRNNIFNKRVGEMKPTLKANKRAEKHKWKVEKEKRRRRHSIGDPGPGAYRRLKTRLERTGWLPSRAPPSPMVSRGPRGGLQGG